MNTKEIIDVIQAFEDGKEIEHSLRTENIWRKGTNDPCWNFARFDYRVKQKPLEYWVNIYDQGRYTYTTKTAARDSAGKDIVRVAVHMKEVV